MRQSRRILALLLCAVMLLGMIPASASAAGTAGFDNFKKVNTYTDGKFSDVKAGDWYADNVKAAYELDLMIGQGAKFGVDSDVTIAETVTLAARLHSIYSGDGRTFEQGSVWYQVYADYVEEKNIFDLSGLDMKASATRAQYAAILSAALPDEALKSINNVADDAIPDAKTGDAYAAAIYKLYRAGILTGTDSKGTYQPDVKIKRSEVSAIVTRMADQSLRKEVTLGNFCKVTFDNGTSSQTVTVESGKTVSVPASPTKSGYSFVGWYTAASGGTKYIFTSAVTADITLHAHWSQVSSGGGGGSSSTPMNHIITFVANGEGVTNLPTTQKVASGQSATNPANPDRGGYIFSGWYLDKNEINLSNQYDFSTPVTKDITLYAKWIDPNLDTDSEGIPDEMEGYFGTDPFRADSDGDGLSDYQECIVIGTNPTVIDTDGNGVSDFDEDADKDGLSNGAEYMWDADPIASDSDMDGLKDGDEVYLYHSDPVVFDTDGDGADDGWEVGSGFDPALYDNSFTVLA